MAEIIGALDTGLGTGPDSSVAPGFLVLYRILQEYNHDNGELLEQPEKLWEGGGGIGCLQWSGNQSRVSYNTMILVASC